MTGDGFSELLGQLKERSGLSYGVLGKRLHMSASTLHRYVNGDAVPTDYAPVERFARVCRATPGELVELHRRWVLADARRGQRGAPAPEATGTPGTPGTAQDPHAAPHPPAGTDEDAGAVQAPHADAHHPPHPEAAPDSGPSTSAPDAGTPSGSPQRQGAAVAGKRGGPSVRRRRRTVALAGAGVAAVALSVALIVSLVPGGPGDDDARSAGSAATGSRGPEGGGRGPSPSGSGASESPSSPSSSPTSSASGPPGAKGPAAVGASGGADSATAPTVVTDPYYWNSPCEQHYLVDREPAQVPPPPGEDDARGWVTALGGVASDEHWVRLTVQGTGRNTVVVDGLHVRVVKKGAPLAWNDYQMGVDACGGGVETRHFGVDLDAGRPVVTPKAGQQDFPYKVSESDPEVYYVTARTSAHDVSWYLELDWSSGEKHGTVRIDDNGQPFRTSANADRPGYDYPLGYNDRWEVADGKPGAPPS